MLNGFPTCRCTVGAVAIPKIDDQGMWVAHCVSAANPDELALDSIPVREPNLPYPGRITPMEPMPIDMPPTMDGPDDNDPEVPSPQDRMVGMKTTSNDGGCSSASSDGLNQLWWVFLPFALLGLRRRRS